MTATREFIKPDDAEGYDRSYRLLTHASLEAGEERASPHQSYWNDDFTLCKKAWNSRAYLWWG